MSPGTHHIPVLLDEVLEYLAPTDGTLIVDCTFGGGGYTRALLSESECKVIGVDRDGAVIAAARPMLRAFGGRLTLCHGRFGQLAQTLDELGIEGVDGVVMDLGVSSIQLDTAERGFSFMRDGPLDMRMGGDDEDGTLSAADIVNREDEKTLQSIFSRYGEERRSRTLAQAIVKRRAETPFTRTLDLAAVAEQVLGKGKPGEIHPATRLFQALRIHVNNELGELVRGLLAAERVLKPGGRLVCVSFHSLEDRIVKTFLQTRDGHGGQGSRHAPPLPESQRTPSFHTLTRGVVTARDEEVNANPRARSAKLRAAERTQAPAWPEDWDAYDLIEDRRV